MKFSNWISEVINLNKGELGKYLTNTSWLISEKVYSLFLVLVISIVTARYLGPSDYGILTYSISLGSIFAIATHLGLSSLAVKYFVEDDRKEVVDTIFLVKVVAAVIASLSFVSYLIFVGDHDEKWWISIYFTTLIIFRPFEVYEFWFQAKVKAKYPSFARSIAKTVLAVLVVSFVIFDSGLELIAIAFALEVILFSLLVFYFYDKFSARKPLLRWKLKKGLANSLLSQGWMIMLGAIFAVVYYKIDQVMLKTMVNTTEVGIYSVSVKLSEAVYFIPTALTASIFPKLIEIKNQNSSIFQDRIQQLFNILFSMSFLIIIMTLSISEFLITTLYGQEYSLSVDILNIHIFATIFIFIRAAIDKWIIIEKAYVFSMVSQGVGALSNVLMNLLLIPKYGGVGASIATVVSYAISSYFVLIFAKKTRGLFFLVTRSYLSPFYFMNKFIKKIH